MFFNPRKRAAAHDLDVALYYLLHGATALVPLLKESYKDKWSGFIDDILKGTPPYEEATALIGIFLRSSFQNLDRDARDQIVASIQDKNVVNHPNLLRAVGQVACMLYLAEQDKKVRDKLWTVWVNDMAKMFADTGNIPIDHCISYLLDLANSFRDEMHAKKQEKKVPVEQAKAHKLGSDAAQSMTAELDRFMRLRFGPVRDGYLKVLRDCFERSFNPPEAPPIIMARVEYKSFLKNVGELRQKMPADINTAMRGWRDLSDEMGMQAEFDQLVNHHVEAFMSNLTSDGLQMFLDLADSLKAADDRWRAAHPEKSAQFPPDP